MKQSLGTTGLVLNEPLLWEKGKRGRSGFSLPRRDVETCHLDEDLMGLNRVSRSPHNDGLIMLLIRRCSHRVDGLGLTDDE